MGAWRCVYGQRLRSVLIQQGNRQLCRASLISWFVFSLRIMVRCFIVVRSLRSKFVTFYFFAPCNQILVMLVIICNLCTLLVLHEGTKLYYHHFEYQQKSYHIQNLRGYIHPELCLWGHVRSSASLIYLIIIGCPISATVLVLETRKLQCQGSSEIWFQVSPSSKLI